MSAPTSALWTGFARSNSRRKTDPRYLLIPACAAAAVALSTLSFAQDGHHGAGHDTWHENFYSKLIRKDTKTSCCNLADCRPTESRMVGDHYEVKVDDDWLPVPKEAIQNITAPDGGTHVCAPRQSGRNKGTIYCVVLPPEI
jgi:hypothetical protein